MPEAAPQRESISRQPGFWSRFRRLAIVRILLGSVFVVATVAVIQMGSGFAARNPNIKYFFAVTRLPALVVVGVRARDAWVRERPQRVVIASSAALRIIQSRLGCRLVQFKLCAHSLDLRRL